MTIEAARNLTDVLAGAIDSRNQRGGSVGTRYAQKPNLHFKREARLRVLDEFTRPNFPYTPLRILTFPFTNWVFEGMLLNQRHGSGAWKFGQKVGGHTQIVGIEREVALFKTACRLIPGIRQGIRYKEAPPYARAALRSFAVRRYLLCTFEDLAVGGRIIPGEYFKFNGAWLDFNGPINISRAEAIKAFVQNHCRDQVRLVVTALNGRYDSESATQWGKDKPQAIADWIAALRPIGAVRWLMEYNDGSPMFQVSVDL